MLKTKIPPAVLFIFTIALGTAALAASEAEKSEEKAAPVIEQTLPQNWIDVLKWRSIGPANMGGRIVDIEVDQADSNRWWAATASGGLLKTENNGITFTHQFDHESTVSIGDVAIAPSDPNIVWVGTGEANPRNSVSWGNGVYKSTDGGGTWKHMGLDKCFQTGRIAIHPEDPNIVYVGALGRLWGPNEERGLYKTTDGGKSWDKILFIDDKTGIIDVQMHPENPDTLLVAAYERLRDRYDSNSPVKKWGPGSGLYKTVDGGKTFNKVTKGLPACSLGRIGLDYFQKNPDIVFAIIESEQIGQEPENAPYIGIRGEDAEVGAKLTDITEDGPAEKAGLKSGDIVISVGGKTVLSYRDLLKEVRQHEAGETVKIEVSRERERVVVDITFTKRPGQDEDEKEDAGEERRRPQRSRNAFSSGLGGQRENVQDQQGKEGHEYGGVYKSTDGGESWIRINSVNPRPMYFSQIRVDPSDENHLYVLGISLYRSNDGGKSFTSDGGRGVHADHHGMWIDPKDGRHIILGTDGGIYVTYDRMENWDHLNHMAIGQFYHVGVGPRSNYMVYGGLQDNGSWGGPNRSRAEDGPINEDWFCIGWGDGFICLVDQNNPDLVYYASQNGGLGRYDLENGNSDYMRPRSQKGKRYRFNWMTPYILSNHNPGIYYCAGNHVFRSLYQGEKLKSISPEISSTDKGSASALAESCFDPDVLYVGTDDGALWMTENGGHDWVDLFDVIEGEDDEEAEVMEKAEPEKKGGQPFGEAGRRGRSERESGGERGRGGDMLLMLKQQDANEDGKIQKDEVSARLARMFDYIDANSDDVIDEKELDALTERFGGGAPSIEADAEPDKMDKADAVETVEPPPAAEEVVGRLEAIESVDSSEKIEPAPEEETTSPEGEQPETPEALKPQEEPEKAQQEEEQAAPDEKDEEKAPAEEAVEEEETVEKAVSEKEETAEAAEEEPKEDPITGEWSTKAVGQDIPESERKSRMFLKLGQGGKVTGTIQSPMGEGDIINGKFNAETKSLTFGIDAGQMQLDVRAKIKGAKLEGTIEMAGGVYSFGFEGKRVSTGAAGPADGEKEAEEEDEYEWHTISELLPDPRRISSIEPSRFKKGRVYISLDGHRSNDDEPYLFVSKNNGKSWRSIRANLPSSTGSVRVIREDIENPDILYLGTEFFAWISIERGKSWTKLNSNLPTVAIHEFAQHKSSGEVAVATHGRSIWILDVTPLRQMTGETISENAYLFEPNAVHYWKREPRRGGDNRRFVGENPSSEANIFYALNKRPGRISLKIIDLSGETMRELEASSETGVHKVSWDLRKPAPARGGGRGGSYSRRGSRIEPGKYLVELRVDNMTLTQILEVKGDPEFPDARLWGEAYDEQQERGRAFER